MKRLTPRQHQIVALMSEGRSNPEIARELDLNVQTIKNHLTDAYKRLQIETAGAPGHRAVALYASGQLGASAES